MRLIYLIYLRNIEISKEENGSALVALVESTNHSKRCYLFPLMRIVRLNANSMARFIMAF